MTEYVRDGYDNLIQLQLLSGGSGIDLSAVTQIDAIFNEHATIASTDSTAGTIRWSGAGFTTGEIRLDLGDQSITEGYYDVEFIIYAPAYPNGQYVSTEPIQVPAQFDFTLIATAACSNSNSYCTLAEANAYHETRYHNSSWWTTTETNKKRLLTWATRMIDDLLIFKGDQATDDQALLWPRTNVWTPEGISVSSASVPAFVKEATAEYAFHLIAEDLTLESNRDTMGFKKMKAGPLELEVDSWVAKPMMPRSVRAMFRDYATNASGRPRRTLERM